MIIKGKKIKNLLMIIIMFILLSLGSTVFADTYLFTSTPSEPYEFNPYFFCINKGQGLGIKDVTGIDLSSRLLEYESKETKKAEQSIAYAFYTASQLNNWDEVTIQKVVWASDQFKGLPNFVQVLLNYKGYTTSPTSSSAIEARSNQYAQFYYGILNGGNKMSFTTETNNSKVLVDQDAKTYTVGPYKVDVNTPGLSNAVKDAKTILYNELSGINSKNYPGTTPFATYEITGLDGTNIHFIDKSGNTIEFPNWGEEFYIRYNPTTGITKINPRIKIKYQSRVDCDITVYAGKKETFKGTVEGLWVKEDDFKAEDYVGSGTFLQNGNAGAEMGIKNLTVTSLDKKVVSEKVGSHWDANQGKQVDDYADVTYIIGFTYTAEIANPEKVQEVITISGGIHGSYTPGYEIQQPNLNLLNINPVYSETDVDLGVKDISVELGGNVWIDLPGIKIGDLTGIRSGEDSPFAGMQVQLFDEGNSLVATTTTDSNGSYHFYKLDPLKKYYVKYTYNGQIYQNTYYKNNLTGGYSNAQEENREGFNNRFGKIDSTPNNYKVGNEWHKAYALLSKLAKENGEYIANGTDENGNVEALTYQDAWNRFLELAINTKSYSGAYAELENWLRSKEVGNADVSGVITFIQDSMITATTRANDPLKGNNLVTYPVYNQFVVEDLDNPTEEIETVTLDKTYYYLYTKKSDQSRYVDFGICLRTQEELYLQKDVYKATVLVNGKKHDYMYSKKNLNDDGSWSVEVRASDELYNGKYTYSREVRKSEYLYNGSDSGSSNAKNLQVFVTYRLAVKNRSQLLYSSVNEIVDYYDSDQYTFDGTLNANGTYTPKSYNNYDENGNVTESYVNSYLGSDAKGGKAGEITISNETSFADREKSKQLTNGKYKYDSLYITGMKSPSGSDRLAPGEIAYAYITFKVNNDPATGKVKLDQDLNTGNVTIGKRNIAEINGYSTYYSEKYTVPGHLNEDNSKVDTAVGNKVAGIIDTLSNAGSLEEIDLTENGDLRSAEKNEVENRLEMDTDKAPNLKVVISQDDDDTRRMSGYVFEDERTVTNDKAVVGDGKYSDNENKINGVTVELVELIQNVDNNGIFLGSYNGEKVWGTNIYEFQDNQIVKTDENFDRYFSGEGLSKVIIKGPGILDVTEDNIGKDNGQYSFKSVPAGDFFVRFTYGDNIQTVLLNGENEVNSLLNQKGLNAKSYNGQDYKTTSYQVEVDQNSKYNGINGFTNYDVQNYNNYADKSAMYYYDIGNSQNVQNVSDAKDVYSYRESVNNWSAGAKDGTLLNNRAETLTSFEKLGTYKYDNEEEQRKAEQSKINDLINNTKMVAQTGVIDTEVEYNTKSTTGQGTSNKLPYKIEDLDLGLVERPEAQVKLNKEITNFKLVLSNNKTLFDTTQSVNNLYFAKHSGHSAKFEGFRLVGYEIGKNSKQLPELIQAFLDEELIAGASIEAIYEISAENVGEVDYLDKQFYYTGKTANAEDVNNVSTTNVKNVIDYVSNLSRFETNYQNVDANWTVTNANNLISSTKLNDTKQSITDETKIDEDIVNREYIETISTYNTLITTDKLSGNLLPSILGKDNSETKTTLVLSALLSDNVNENFVYNNLAEIVATSNSQGRRMQYSISGNQQMSDQSLGNDASEELYTAIDLVTPEEIDADSAQKIVILPPQGEDKNILPIVLTSLGVAFILGVGIMFIKKRV